MAYSVNAGADELKRANFGSKLEQWKPKHESGCNVVTFQRHDVPTSRRPHVVTFQRRDVPTSRRSNVATFQRRDVPTSRRPHVATLGQPMKKSTSSNVVTSQCRDVATSRRQHEICPPSFKPPRVQNSRHREAYELGHENPEQQRHRL